MARGLPASLLLFLMACAADPSAEPGEGEDDITFHASVVDKTLPDVDAIGYAITLRVDDSNRGHETFTADVKGNYVTTRALDELALDFDGNTVDEVRVDNKPAEHRRDGARLVVKLGKTIAEGKSFSTRIVVHGDVRQVDGANPNDFAAFGGLMVKQKNTDGNKRIFTSLNWPSKARRWLPLRDHPSDGAMVTFDVTFPKQYTVLANGKKVSDVENGDGSKTWHYESLTPMPPYDFHVSAYDDWTVDQKSAGSGVPVTSYTYAADKRTVPTVYGDLTKTLDFYESTFGKYRWGTATFIEEPIFGGGMEHASVVSMDETLFPDPKEARNTAFHELGHHWSGNLVRIRQWNDFWLSEGFTEYLTLRARTALYGAAEEKKVVDEYREEAFGGDQSTPHALAPRGNEIDVLTIFDAIPYQKGALTLRMLEHVIGRDKMDAFLKGWFDRHAFTAVTTNDFEREITAAAGKDLSQLFATFVYDQWHPELKVTFAPAGAETEIKVEQVQRKGPANGFVFPLDLDFVDDAGKTERVVVDLTSKSTVKRVTLARTPKSVVVDPEKYAVAEVK